MTLNWEITQNVPDVYVQVGIISSLVLAQMSPTTHTHLQLHYTITSCEYPHSVWKVPVILRLIRVLVAVRLSNACVVFDPILDFKEGHLIPTLAEVGEVGRGRHGEGQ